MKISKRVMAMQYSAIRELIPLAQSNKEQGVIVNHLNIGVPDLNTPPQFLDAIKTFNDSVNNYAPSNGLKELRVAVSDFFAYRYNLSYDSDEIVITNGASEALTVIFMLACDFGDNIISADPYYSNYKSFFDQSGLKLKTFKTTLEDGFKLPEVSKIESLVDDKTKAILICNPANPTGKVYSKDELEVLVKIARKHDLYLIADEIYRDYLYDDIEFTSLADFKDDAERVIIIDSVSKRFSACGVRIGAILSKNKDVILAAIKLSTSRLALPTISQIGAIALYNLRDNYLDDVLDIYKVRREMMYNALKDISGVKVFKPEGAFYLMAKLPINNSRHFVEWLLSDFRHENETVMLAPANGFYQDVDSGQDEVRIAFATDDKIIKKGIELLKLGLDEYLEIY